EFGNLNTIVCGVTVFNPVGSRDTHRDWFVCGPDFTDCIEYLEWELCTVVDAATVFVSALIRNRREERRQQIAVCCVNFDEIKACFIGSTGGIHEVLDDFVHTFTVDLCGYLVVRPIWDRRGRCRGPVA